jgi:hypothetical protein
MKIFVASLLAAMAIAVVAGAALAAPKQAASKSVLKRGQYLVEIGGCNDCHTPWKMGPNGPEPDMSRMLSGHPESLAMPPPPQLPLPWGAATSATFTAWSGPWGVSYSANLTPDPETGLGKWTVQNFIEAMRTGRHEGRGRPILPPMPAKDVAKMTDDDLKATFAFLQSIPPIKNHVPNPTPPAGEGAAPPPSSSGATAPPGK